MVIIRYIKGKKIEQNELHNFVIDNETVDKIMKRVQSRGKGEDMTFYAGNK